MASITVLERRWAFLAAPGTGIWRRSAAFLAAICAARSGNVLQSASEPALEFHEPSGIEPSLSDTIDALNNDPASNDRRMSKPANIMVAVTTRNRDSYVEFQGRMVRSALRGTMPLESVFILDDASSDFTPEDLDKWYGPWPDETERNRHIRRNPAELGADQTGIAMLKWFDELQLQKKENNTKLF